MNLMKVFAALVLFALCCSAEDENIGMVDLIVVGGGTNGISSAYQAAKLGKSVLLIEQFSLFSSKSSSYGASRMFRTMYDDPLYLQMSEVALPLWHQLESEFNTQLIQPYKAVWYGNASTKAIINAMSAMEANEISFDFVNGADLTSTYTSVSVPPNYTGLISSEKYGGIIHAQTTLESMVKVASANYGVKFHENETVLAILPYPTYVLVRTNVQIYKASNVIIASGPFVNDVLKTVQTQTPQKTVNVSVWEVTFAYYEITQTNLTYPMFYSYYSDWEIYYGFPPNEFPNLIKVGCDFSFHHLTDPSQRTYTPDPKCLAMISSFLETQMPSINPQPQNPVTCVFNVSPDFHYIIDWLPQTKNVLLISGDSGQGFKYTPFVGTVAAAMINGTLPSQYEKFVKAFSINRPGILV